MAASNKLRVATQFYTVSPPGGPTIIIFCRRHAVMQYFMRIPRLPIEAVVKCRLPGDLKSPFYML